MDRRTFLGWMVKLSALVGGAPAWLRLLAGCDDGAARPEGTPAPAPSGPPVIEPADVPILEAVLERLLPGGAVAGAPGAREAGVLAYIERQLALPHLRAQKGLLVAGLRHLHATALREHGRTFAELDAERQDDLLARFQRNDVGRTPISGEAFFDVAQTLALEGYWGDPRHGGNRDHVTWQWAGLAPGCGGRGAHGACGGDHG